MPLYNPAATNVSNITGLGAGIATWLATPSSANLNTALTTKTGSGNAAFGTSPALTTPTLGGVTLQAGQYPGEPTNGNATAGNVGEFFTVSASGVSFSTGTPLNVCSQNITAGDWDIWGYFGVSNTGATTYTALQYSLSTTNGVLGLTMGENVNIAGATYTRPLILQRFQFTTTTLVFIVCQFTFSGGAPTAQGTMYARRAR